MEITLEPVEGPADQALTLLQGNLTIGRSRPSDVVIESRLISKIHAILRRTGDDLVIEDLSTPNGTFVNGQRIQGSHPLSDGDTVSVAGVRTYRVHLKAPSPTPRPGPGAGRAVKPRGSDETIVRPRDVSVRLHGAAGDFVVRGGSHVIGRRDDAGIVIDDQQVSRQHAVITIAGFRVTVEDQDSANGTMVNGELLKAPRVLRSGDTVRFGDLEFTVTIQTGQS